MLILIEFTIGLIAGGSIGFVGGWHLYHWSVKRDTAQAVQRSKAALLDRVDDLHELRAMRKGTVL